MNLENVQKIELQKLAALPRPASAALVPHPGPKAAPLQEHIRSDGDVVAVQTGRILAGKRIYLALDNASFRDAFNGCVVLDEHNFKHTIKIDPKEPVDEILTNSLMSITDSATLLRILPDLRKDVLIIENPSNMDGQFEAFERGLAAFRKANPDAVVIAGFPIPPVNMAQIEALQKAGLIDYVDERPAASTTSLLGEAAVMIEGNAAMHAKTECPGHPQFHLPPPVTEPPRN